MRYPSVRSLLPLLLALVSLVLAAGAGFGTRLGYWTFRTGFDLLRWSAYLAGGVACGSLILVMYYGWKRYWTETVAVGLALLIGASTASVPVSWMRTARRVPPIHDITTDTENPPEFDAVRPLRRDAANDLVYGGPEVAAQQKRAYPGVRPLYVSSPPETTLQHAVEVGRSLGWTLVSTRPGEGVMEAVDTTFWFGFKDDVVVRVRSVQQGTRVDVRSVSRVGVSDVGTNARRIRRFLETLEDRVSDS